MCGIFGFISQRREEITEGRLRSVIGRLLRLSERRGNEASGLTSVSGDKVFVYKQVVKPSAMLKARGFSEFIKATIGSAGQDGCAHARSPVAVVGHARLVTNGSQAIMENNQPIRSGHIVGVHNGIVTNDREIVERYLDSENPLSVYSDSDTEVLFSLINRYFEQGDDMPGAVAKSYSDITGTASIAFLCDMLPILVLATNTGSLYYSLQENGGFFIFGSERYIVEKFLRKNNPAASIDFQAVRQLEPLTTAILRLDEMALDIFHFDNIQEKRDTFYIRKNTIYDIVDISLPQNTLRRCTKCALPCTYPFISFDKKGVCNYCRRYQKQEFKGRQALEPILEKYRSKNGKPDCIMGFSGGRDSSYGLHVLKKELGMHPIAYTYDWGMVTDLARRNQAKVTGKLGIEHIIRSANLHAKRQYIRKNIYAWLKKPELGMVPLFMAGDKMFYYYGRQLRKETGIKLTVFACGHQLEQMEFKIGFCGIDQPLVNNQRMYSYNTWSKIKMAKYYITQYLTNPAYINESFLDSIFSYYCSFISKDDYLYLYNYIPWEEKVIERTLREGYDWESDKSYGKNQWRMGDGHTAFIDYIYYTVAGFSEFDNFRSNQIREGLITREKALELIREENKPRLDMLLEFSQLIGFNLEDVLLKINAIPKLYQGESINRASRN